MTVDQYKRGEALLARIKECNEVSRVLGTINSKTEAFITISGNGISGSISIPTSRYMKVVEAIKTVIGTELDGLKRDFKDL